MFAQLIAVTFVVALAVSAAIAVLFASPIRAILRRVVDDAISAAWVRYLNFAVLVVGISAGVRVGELEKYITPLRGVKDSAAVELTRERWLLEVYRTVIEALQGIAWMLLVFFVFALVAFVIVRANELRRRRSDGAPAA